MEILEWKFMYYLKHEQEYFIRYKTRERKWLKNDPSDELISEVILKVNVVV
jgi:hypothetical protein